MRTYVSCRLPYQAVPACIRAGVCCLLLIQREDPLGKGKLFFACPGHWGRAPHCEKHVRHAHAQIRGPQFALGDGEGDGVRRQVEFILNPNRQRQDTRHILPHKLKWVWEVGDHHHKVSRREPQILTKAWSWREGAVSSTDIFHQQLASCTSHTRN